MIESSFVGSNLAITCHLLQASAGNYGLYAVDKDLGNNQGSCMQGRIPKVIGLP